jgi:hypothetical protein
VTADDVRDLVAEVVPGSIWAFVDAVGMRQRPRSLELLERLLDGTPEPVLLAVLHRRIRELLEIADRLAGGETPGSLVRSMRLQPFRAETLARQAKAWTVDELAAALEGLLELDSLVKGVGGAIAGEAGRLALTCRWQIAAPAAAVRLPGAARKAAGREPMRGRSAGEIRRHRDQALWITRSLSIANVHRPVPRSRSSMRSGSM